MIDALRLLVQFDLDALQQSNELIDLPAEVFVFHPRDVGAAAGKIVDRVTAVPGFPAIVAAVVRRSAVAKTTF